MTQYGMTHTEWIAHCHRQAIRHAIAGNLDGAQYYLRSAREWMELELR